MDGADPRAVRRLRSAFGRLYPTLLEEAPERAAWTRLTLEAVEAVVARARDRVGEAGHALGFRTLLKQELDAECGLAPAAMSFEASSLPPERRVVLREARRDERARERERAAQTRRDDLYRQAARLLTRDEDDV